MRLRPVKGQSRGHAAVHRLCPDIPLQHTPLVQLGKIVASSEESHSFWQRRDYKAFGPNTDWDNVDWDAGEAAGGFVLCPRMG